MLKNTFKNLDRKKLKMFAVFLAFSFLSWSISKLSQSYESWVEVNLVPTQFPDSLFVKENSSKKARLQLKASGFRLLTMGLGTRNQKVDLSAVSSKNYSFFLTNRQLVNQWERKFSNAEVLNIQPDTVFFDLYQVQSKKVKVKANIKLQLAQSHVLAGELQIKPDSVLIKGPLSEIEGIKSIRTEDHTFEDISESFERNLKLVRPKSFADSEISESEVVVSGLILKFSEKIFKLPIYVEKTPKNYELKVFPNTVSLLCKAGEDDLRTLSEENFRVVAIYDSTKVNQNTIKLSLSREPENAISVRLLEDEVKFVLEPK